MNAIEVCQVSKRYPAFTLEDVSLTLPEGCIMGLIGENGAGKSTLIRMLLGLCAQDGGEVKLLGVDTRDDQFCEIKDQIGVVLDEAGLPEMLSARQMEKVMRNAYGHWSHEQFDKYMNAFSLPQDKKVKDYSRGMKMKLLIAVALSHGARLLILDEATSGLDPIVRDEILSILSDFTRDEKCSILISSHILSDLDKLCDYITFLHDGKLILSEGKDEMLEKYAVLKCGKSDFEALDKAAIVGCRTSPYGVEALVLRDRVPTQTPLEQANLEDVMLYKTKGEKVS